ncbi:MAG: helix-turn-helix domain-containing protein, partial [Acidobacteriota bacterium]|nr:helix-turn-helix domain-containing protein [Acidobacteriota bacterium]
MRDGQHAGPIDAAVGARIHRRRTELGLSVEMLSAKIGLSNYVLRKFEYGSSRLSPGRLVMIAHVLDVGIAFFFDPADWAGMTELPRFPRFKRVNHGRPRGRFTTHLDQNMLKYGHPEESGWMKVLVVDDHVLIREALCSVLTELLPNISVFEASDYSQAIKL